MVVTKRQYANPPLVEAVCEFRFDSASAWDPAVPGLLYNKVKGDFPIRRATQTFQGSVNLSPTGVQQRFVQADRAQFVTQDGRLMVQVGPHILAVNHLKPYSGWEHFLPRIQQALSAYREVAEPSGIIRMTLHYIDQFHLPATHESGESVTLEHYLNFHPTMGSIPGTMASFFMGVQLPSGDARDMLQMELITIDPPEGSTETLGVWLQLSTIFRLLRTDGFRFEDVPVWLEVAHARLGEVFEGCLTDNLRALFGGETP